MIESQNVSVTYLPHVTPKEVSSISSYSPKTSRGPFQPQKSCDSVNMLKFDCFMHSVVSFLSSICSISFGM